MEHCKPLLVFQGIVTVINIYILKCVVASKHSLIDSTVDDLCTINSSNIHVKRCRLSKILNCFLETGLRYFTHLTLS